MKPWERLVVPASLVLLCLALAWMWGAPAAPDAPQPAAVGDGPGVLVPPVSLDSLLAEEASAVRAPGASPALKEDSDAVAEAVGEAGGDAATSDAASPTPHPLALVPEARPLTEREFLALLASTPWSRDRYHEVLRVACGPAVRKDGQPAPWGESACIPSRLGDFGELGLLQLLPEWASACGVEPEALFDALTNLACAYHVEAYGQEVRGEPWTWWSVRP